jgi:hypothetical protein
MKRAAIEAYLAPKPSTIAQLRRARPDTSWAKPDPEHKTLSWKVGVYTCPELQTNPGLHDSRMDAYRLPSRVGNKRYYPDGRVELVA